MTTIYWKLCSCCRRPFTTAKETDSQCYSCKYGAPGS